MGKNTLHFIGLDDKGTIVLRENFLAAARLANVLQYLIGIEAAMATHLRGSRADRGRS